MRRARWIAAITVVAAAGLAATSFAHYNVITGNDSANNLDGHDHTDEMHGRGGGDDMNGQADGDAMWGGDQNDAVRGNANGDSVHTYEDWNGGDNARGGDGYDGCAVNPADNRDDCEEVYVY
jgi:hypothetical protein